MRASTELFLWEMYSIAESLFYPSYRYSNESFEGWAYRRGLLRQIQRLEREAYLERQPGGKADRVYRLTPKGRLAALGGKDPEERWNRSWDGRWRLLMFDLPQAPAAPRKQLRKVLREHGLGCLQGSVWVSPDQMDSLRKQMRGDRHPSSLLLFEGDAVGGEKPGEVVREAWDFSEIEQYWASYSLVLEQGKELMEGRGLDREKLREWSAREHASWKEVIKVDPLLPAALLPRGYSGRKVWRRRLGLWRKIAARFQKSGGKPLQQRH